MEAYIKAKFLIGKALARSGKRPRAIIANKDNALSAPYLALPVEESLPFSLSEATDVVFENGTSSFTFEGVRFFIPHPGNFSIMNALAVIKTARFLGVSLETSRDALKTLTRIPGRAETIDEGQPYSVVIDYAHTPDSLEALYQAYEGNKICVLGNTGGGRDTWKRPLMGKIADTYCREVILTDEDPYDEDPRSIVESMTTEMKRTPTIIMDRRQAINEALTRTSCGHTERRRCGVIVRPFGNYLENEPRDC
jgi:UDP-N-acetylmuramoyl-L-alanyl-D-glutamate--2,6-diaminopimelate ligase